MKPKCVRQFTNCLNCTHNKLQRLFDFINHRYEFQTVDDWYKWRTGSELHSKVGVEP